MQKKYKNNFYHGMMFHHFHDGKTHPKFQGSINKKELLKLISFVGKKNILDPDDFYEKYKNNQLNKKNICLTFDDGLRSQYDIAIPVLENLNIKAIFFIYSSIYDREIDFLEIYRYFRAVYYKDIEKFYSDFFLKVKFNLSNFFKLNANKINNFKNKFPFYSLNDVKFRILRDYGLSKSQYHFIMMSLFKEKKFDYNKIIKKIFINKTQLKHIERLGHSIGLHTHNHPTLIEKYSIEKQLYEYKKNIKFMNNILSKDYQFKYMSHPNGSYDKKTLKVLNKLNIKLGFTSNINVDKRKGMNQINNSNFEIAREDHSNLIKFINA